MQIDALGIILAAVNAAGADSLDMDSVVVALIAYTAAATLLTITPGLDTALVLRTAATEGARRALWSGLGIITGCLVWATLVAAGLGVLLIASHPAYTVLRWLGAAYLLFVGLQLLRKPRTHIAGERTANRRTGSAFTRGALTNLLNPKVGFSTCRSCHSSSPTTCRCRLSPCCSVPFTLCWG